MSRRDDILIGLLVAFVTAFITQIAASLGKLLSAKMDRQTALIRQDTAKIQGKTNSDDCNDTLPNLA